MKYFLLLTLLFSTAAKADLKEDFEAVNKESKGAFGQNYLQGTSSRTTVSSGKSPKNFLFQAAYRNEKAQILVDTHQFYLGNLFTTNYYQLMGEYVYGDVNSDHEIDHSALLANSQEAMKKASLIIKHWVLEKHYIFHFPNTNLAKGFAYRGIGGSEFERPYAEHFFNFYLSSMNDDFQYLPAFLLVNQSPIVDSSSLDKARLLISDSYEYFKARFGANDDRVKALFKLRNAIHNQLSKAVIAQIDQYYVDYPFYLEEGHTYLGVIREILVDYFSFSADKISKDAAAIGLSDLQAAADQITTEGAITPENLLALSRVAAQWKTDIGSDKIDFKNRARTLAVLTKVSRFLNKELAALENAKNPAAIEAVVNTIYLEGFLIKDNWQYFKDEVPLTSDYASLLSDILEIAGGGTGSTLQEAFKGAYEQWLIVEPKMEYFLDNTIKSSSLNMAALVAEKVR